MLYTILIVSFNIVMLLGVIGIIRSIHRYYILMDVMFKYPTFGGTEVRVIRKRSLERGSRVKGTFSRSERVIEIALNNSLKDVVRSYLHERRHSEQAFGSDAALNEMYLVSSGVLGYLRSSGQDDHETYLMSEHEVDAREVASKLTEEYLANR